MLADHDVDNPTIPYTTNAAQTDTVPLMTVGTLPVTRACSVPQTSPLVSGYRGVYIQMVKTGGGRVFVVKSGHLYLENRGNS